VPSPDAPRWSIHRRPNLSDAPADIAGMRPAFAQWAGTFRPRGRVYGLCLQHTDVATSMLAVGCRPEPGGQWHVGGEDAWSTSMGRS
jgi:hypothetical protein